MDVDQLIRIIQRYFLTPLNNMPDAQIKLLETNHDQSVQDFQNAIGLLFPQGDPVFQGKAADAFADYIGHYLDAEEALSPYDGNELSERINTLFSKCNALLSQEEGIIKSIQGSDVWGTAGKTFVGAEVTAAPFEIGAPPDAPVAQIIVIAAVAIAIVGVSIAKQNQVHSLTDTLNQWVSDMQNLAQQLDPPGSELPPLPAEIKTDTTYDTEQIVAQFFNITLNTAQEQLIQKLAKEYGLSPEEIATLLSLDPTVTEAELRKKIERYLQLSKQYPDLAKNHPEWLLWAAAFDLPDSAVAILANLNNGQSTIYSKGQPYNEVAADILAAVLGDLVQKAYQRLNDLMKQARAALKEGKPLDQAIPGWAGLPESVKQLLAGTSPQPYKYQYGNALESLVMQQFKENPQYAAFLTYFKKNFGLLIEDGLPGRSKLIPDFQITVDGHTDVLDITSMKNSPTKVKYNVDGVEINIVLPYGQ